MKPKDKSDIFFQEELDMLEGPTPAHLRQKILEARRAIKKDRNRTRRNKERREMKKALDKL